MSDSVAWYEANAQLFFDRSVDAPMLEQQRRFADLLPPGGRVLDAGCGAGRDANVFRDWGFEVTATEAAPALAELARAHTGIDVQVMTFDQMAWTEAFDGVWACASLLHAPRAALPDTLRRLRRALVPRGAWFMSFKYGQEDRESGGRWFTDLDEAGAQALLAAAGGLEPVDLQVTHDVRPDRARGRWLSILCRRLD